MITLRGFTLCLFFSGKSWWKKLNENSQDVMEVLEDNKVPEANDIIEEFIDIEVLRYAKLLILVVHPLFIL